MNNLRNQFSVNLHNHFAQSKIWCLRLVKLRGLWHPPLSNRPFLNEHLVPDYWLPISLSMSNRVVYGYDSSSRRRCMRYYYTIGEIARETTGSWRCAVRCGSAYLPTPNRFRKAALFEFEIKESIRAQICKVDNFRRLKIFRISVRTEVTH